MGMLLLASCTVYTSPSSTTNPPQYQQYQTVPNCRWVGGYFTYRTETIWVPGKWVWRRNNRGVARKVWVPGRQRAVTRKHWVNGQYICN